MSRFEELFSAAGNDYAALSERTFGDEELMAQLMSMLLSDDSFDKMRGFMDCGDTEKAFGAAHALKGSCGMLGFTALFEAMKLITDKLRYGDPDGARELLDNTAAEYEKAMALIKKLLG